MEASSYLRNRRAGSHPSRMSSRSAPERASRGRRRTAGGIPPRGNNKQRIELCGLPKARPISCNDYPAFQRLQISVLCAGESLARFPSLINTILKQHVYQMVLHRPIESTPFVDRDGHIYP
jgi:hypothetical protein